MATAGTERGLTLRSPGPLLRRRRPARRALRATARTRRRPGAARPGRRRLDRRRGLPAATPSAPSRGSLAAASPGRRVEPQQGLLVRARRRAPRDRARPARRREAELDVDAAGCEGYAVLAVRPDLRRHQRDPAQHRRRARARPPAEEVADALRLHRRSAAVPRHRRATCSPRSARPRPCAARWPNDDRPRAPSCGPRSPRWASSGSPCPRPHGGLGMNEVDLVLLLDEAGRVALPEPLVETTAVVAPLLAENASGAVAERWLPGIAAGEAVATRAARRSALRAPTPTSPTCSWSSTTTASTPCPATSCAHRRSSRSTAPAGSSRVDFDAADAELVVSGEAGLAGRQRGLRPRRARRPPRVLVGLAEQMIDMTVEYVVARATSSACRSAASRRSSTTSPTPSCRPRVRPAARSGTRAYSLAHRRARRSSATSRWPRPRLRRRRRWSARKALQCHGAIGYTFEYDLHLWLKRALGPLGRLGRRRLAPSSGRPRPARH